MLRYLARRLGSGIILLALVSTVTFLLVFGSAGNVATNILGDTASDAEIAQLEEELGVNRPLLVQYGDWVAGAVRGDLGEAWTMSGEVSEILSTRLPVTLSIVGVAVIIVALFSAVLGITAAMRGGWADKLIQVVSIVGFAIPNFWLGLLLVLFFAIHLRLLPATGYTSLTASPSAWAASLTLPVAALVLSGIASVSQQLRGAMMDVLKQDYVRTLRARGVSHSSIFYRHALRNAMPAALTVLSVQFIALLGGSAVIERVFAIPGLGALTVSAAISGDIPVLMGVVVAMIVVVILVNVLIDIIHAWLNPKVRLS